MTRKKASTKKKAVAASGAIHATVSVRTEQMVGASLARAYLDEARLPAGRASALLDCEAALKGGSPEGVLSLSQLTPEEQKEIGVAVAHILGAALWVEAGLFVKASGARGPVTRKDLPEAELPLKEQRAILAAMSTLREGWQGREKLFDVPREIPFAERPLTRTAEDLLTAHAPTYRKAVARYEVLTARARLTLEETAARATKLLTREDGSLAPSPLAWCEERGYSVAAFAGWLLLLAKEESEARVKDAEQRAKAAEQREKAAKKKAKDLKAGLADRIVFPQQTIDATHRPAVTIGLLARAAQGEFFADNATKALAREGMEIHPATLPKLAGLETRVMSGVFRCFTSAEGSAFREQVSVPFAFLLNASGMDKANQPDRKAFFLAMGTLSRKLWRMAVMIPNKKKGSAVYGAEEPLFRFRPAWTQSGDGRRGYTTEEAAGIAHSWATGDGTSWDGPLPDQVVLTLPEIVRVLARRLVIPVGTFEALDRGSQEVRGTNKGSQDLDLALFVEITQTRQARHGGRSYVDRDDLLARHYGADAVKRQRDKGKYKGGYLAAYENSVRVLEAGGVAKRVHTGKPLKRGSGVRDQFELAEGAILTPPPGRDTETLALPLAAAGTP